MSTLVKSNQDLGSIFGSFTDDQIDLIKRTVCKNSTDNELKLFLYTCKHAGLDPLLKQIYAIKRGNSMTIQTSIDGLRLIAERTGRYSPGEDTKYSYSESNELISATAYVKKMTVDGTWHNISSTAYFNEFAQSYNGKLSQFWGKFPHLMISKCAESHALRKAFPFELAGLYSHEEMANGLNKSSESEELLIAENIGNSKEDEVKIKIPEGVNSKEVESYINYLSEHYEKPTPMIRKWINEKSDKFWEAFDKWILTNTEVE